MSPTITMKRSSTNNPVMVMGAKLIVATLLVVGYLLLAPSLLAATLTLSPGTGVYTAGNTFAVSVMVNTTGEPINAAEGSISFNPSELSVINITRGSMFSLWAVEPTFSNSAGTISFGGGSPGGYTGGSGNVLTITFRAKNAGTTRVNFNSGSVLAADGKGTNVLTNMSGGNYTIASADVSPEPEVIEYVAPANTPAAPSVRSSTHPDPAGWYQSDTAELSWTVPAGVRGVRTLLDQNSGSIPTKVYETPIDSLTVEELEQGVSYFHIQFRNGDGWGRVTHYRLAVDSHPPSAFAISLPEEADLSDPEQTLVLTVEDATSPVRLFEVQIDDGEAVEYITEPGSSTITLPPLEPGKHSVIIEAFDAAGNSLIDTFSFSILAFDRPVFTDYPTQLNEGVIPVIKGQTRASSTVTVTLARVGAEPERYTVNSNERGEFTFIPTGTLETGVYELSAVAVDQFGAQSDPSETVRIAVQQPGYIQVGSLVLSVLSVFVPLVALVALLIAFMWYVIYRLRRLRHRVARESGEAGSVLESEIERLAELLHAERDALAASRKNKKLTKAEEHLVSSLETALAETKQRVGKEISDVEDLIDNSK